MSNFEIAPVAQPAFLRLTTAVNNTHILVRSDRILAVNDLGNERRIRLLTGGSDIFTVVVRDKLSEIESALIGTSNFSIVG